jgi:predicted RNA-binding Zn-ribbon protein involved in translation (DUF1610 family)
MGLSKEQKVIFIQGVTRAMVQMFTSLDDPGFCFTCGEETDNCEPDAEKYECPNCDENNVYGILHAIEHPAMRTDYAQKRLKIQMGVESRRKEKLQKQRGW